MTPAIVAAYIVVFVLLVGSGDLGDPRTLIELGRQHRNAHDE